MKPIVLLTILIASNALIGCAAGSPQFVDGNSQVLTIDPNRHVVSSRAESMALVCEAIGRIAFQTTIERDKGITKAERVNQLGPMLDRLTGSGADKLVLGHLDLVYSPPWQTPDLERITAQGICLEVMKEP